ncbi:MAG: thioredoxin family protein [Deltaproteobacteria bacterium]|nr:thioredoxin family protein [Deltaproteobacteria bacterium]
MLTTSKFKSLFFIAAFALLATATAQAAPKVGKPAPEFKGTDSLGKTHDLAQYRGKYIVLEWLNHGCPYVQKHYDSQNMQKLQTEWTKKGVVWLSVVSSAKGKQGNEEGVDANAAAKEKGSHATAILLDSGGAIGKAYEAQTTPHMFVIDSKGTLVYSGAIDDRPSTETDDVNGAKNYVSAALTASMAGKPVEVKTTKSYGCGVHY